MSEISDGTSKDALLARIDELEEEIGRLNRIADNLVIAADVEKEKHEAAEARVAAITQELEGCRHHQRALIDEANRWTRAYEKARDEVAMFTQDRDKWKELCHRTADEANENAEVRVPRGGGGF